MSDFLEDMVARPLSQQAKDGLLPDNLFLGNGSQSLEVAVFKTSSKPNSTIITRAWTDRRRGRPAPVLAVVLHASGVTLCGPIGEKPPVLSVTDVSQAERLCRAALEQPDRHSAIRLLIDAMPSLETELPGINNEGLLALHELVHGAPKRGDWKRAKEGAQRVLGKSGEEVLTGLGYSVEPLDNLTKLLKSKDQKTALAVMLQQGEIPEAGNPRFYNLSPVSYALTKADKENLSWVLVIQGDRIRLYSTKNIGVGRRGRTETFIECQPTLLSTDHLSYLWLLFSAEALADGGSLTDLLDGSKRFAGNLADQLRERIYDTVVPELATGIAKERSLESPAKEDLDLTYEMALTVLFRLLFVAYAEDRDLLPYNSNEAYRRRSLKQKAQELAEAASKSQEIGPGTHHWEEAGQLWRAISTGNREWGVPAYNGTMFSNDPTVSKAGKTLSELKLPNKYFEMGLRALLLTSSPETPFAPVDFRSLSVREFGTIYEGLLESELSLAEQNLTRDKKGNYLPAKEADVIFVKAGDIYLHDRSGARKSSGSYYTPDFAVEYLLDNSLEPALDDHFKRLDALGETDAGEAFFDFRVADIAMGSGHFLVAAIDNIERRFSEYLERRSLPGVKRELADLRAAAMKELREYAEQAKIEDGQLLRRQIARRCIYGVDLNPLAVQLARLSIWIHTFVPGLPLSLLDHTLVHGNSLVGIGTIDEIKKKFEETGGTLFEVDADNLLGKAAEPLKQLAKLSDATVRDIEKGRELIEEARLSTLPTLALCDLITAQPIAEEQPLKSFEFSDWENRQSEIHKSKELVQARKILKGLSPFHFPVAFPEVFLRKRKGFDVILGNPPWEKVKVEEHAFWARHFPGIRGLTQREFEKSKRALYKERPDLLPLLEKEVA
ncbi:MAG: hypothetical protein IH995_01560 [Proteobacteria bacterium]|nr:hypothetical protein [Pseudomonadota bacterium]